MHAYLDDPSSYERRVAQATNLGYFTPKASSLEAASLELEPDQAPRVFEEVLQVLKGNPSDDVLRRALEDLRAACDADYEKACVFLKEEVRGPVKVAGEVVHPLEGGVRRRGAQFAVIVLDCRLEVDGRLHACQVIEDGPNQYAARLIAQLSVHRYTPWMLAGHPMSSPYSVNFNLQYGSSRALELSTEQKLQWARLRVAWSPRSPSAWTNLAAQLAVHAPADLDYPGALERAYALSPGFWWTATEMAWQRIQAGQHAAALMALRPVIRRSSLGEHPNPYVLETAAAAHFGLKQCTEALAEQRKAVELMPAEWPAPEKMRFQARLQDYQAACTPSAPAAP
ncbi:hypothetical protein NR800_17210 [Corallococcus interemptor]|uniref:hypothetical protein n=1 Tax=Corallococcus interemptor TaxID=2316720 RepID=UPI0035D45E77